MMETPPPDPMEETSPASLIREILRPEDQKPTYHITLPVFEGPMELLLHLIKEHRLDIYDIPISLLTREYLAYLDMMRALNLEVAGDFLVMAATLMHIKSRVLLPREKTDGEEEEDPRAELVRRILEYKQFKEAAEHLSVLEKERRKLVPRALPPEWKKRLEEEHLVEMTLFGLLSAFKDVLIHFQESSASAELVRPEITITQKINDWMDLLSQHNGATLQEFLQQCNTVLEKIVAFLALLELVRLHLVRVFQSEALGIIRVVRVESEEEETQTLNPKEETNG